MIQDIIDTGLVQWGASSEGAKVILGGGGGMNRGHEHMVLERTAWKVKNGRKKLGIFQGIFGNA